MSQEALKARSEKWLRTFCEKESDVPGYEKTMQAIENQYWGDEYIHFDGDDAHGSIPSEFWYHYEIVTGIKKEEPPGGYQFSCSC